MERIWEWYENLNEIVYVTDMETNNLIYMNKKGLECFGFSTLEEIKSKKCYEVFQNRTSPCLTCNNNVLKPGEFAERQRWNSVVGKMYSLKDTMVEEEGKKYRIELAFDMTILAEQESLVKEYQKNEDMLNRALKIALSEPTPVASLERLIRFLGSNLKAERMYIFEEQTDGTVSNTYEWCSEGTTPEISNLQNVPFEAVRHWYEEFDKGKNVVIQDFEMLKDEHPLTYEYLKPQNIRTLIVHPIYDQERIIGFYGVDNAPAERLLNISVLFETVGHFISSALKRVLLMQKVENMGFYDRLTGLKNRHALEEYIHGLDKGDSLGVVYADVTGLKKVNDTYGHKAGDELLKRACECLKIHFGRYELFRIGGDEFCVVCRYIREAELEKLVKFLREDTKKHQALMAVGYVWVENYEQNFEALLSLADSLMYRDKREYYQNPKSNRRYG